jgi:hypothetical protein
MHNLHSANLNRHRTKTRGWSLVQMRRKTDRQIHTNVSWASKTYLALSQCLTPSLVRLVRSEVRLVICQDTAASLAYLDAVWSTSPCTMHNPHLQMVVSTFLLACVAMRWVEDAGTRHPYPRSDEARWRPRHQHMANATLPRVASPFLSYHLTIEISGDRDHRDVTQRPVFDAVFVISTTPEWRNRAIPAHPHVYHQCLREAVVIMQQARNV